MSINTNKDRLIKSYIDWLQQNIKVDTAGNYIEMSTPFLDRHNDALDIYVKQKENGDFYLTDGGYVLNDLAISGVYFNTEKRNKLLRTVCNRFGIEKNEEDYLFTIANEKNFPQKKHNLIQALLCIDDMFITSRNSVAQFFLEEVMKFLKKHQIRFSQSVQFSGKSGYNHSFDAVIPSSTYMPERIISTINGPNRSKVDSLLFSWLDIVDTRPEQAVLYAFLNDSSYNVSSNVLEALNAYNIETIQWSQADQYVDKLIS